MLALCRHADLWASWKLVTFVSEKTKKYTVSKIASHIWSFLSHFKYHIVIVLGVAIVGFLDENSFVKRMEYEHQIAELKQEIAKYNARYEAASTRLKNLNKDSKAISKIARECYMMKADDEDIFVLSDDPQLEDNYVTGHEAIE